MNVSEAAWLRAIGLSEGVNVTVLRLAPWAARCTCASRAALSWPSTESSRVMSRSLPMTDAACVVALVGRPNAGKSSLFNAVTGGHAKVGNFPGVTVEVLDAKVKLSSGEHLELVDLPGVYSVEGEAIPRATRATRAAFWSYRRLGR